jgi:hypothetical protein
MKILGWLLRAVALILVLIVALFLGARLHDGPLGPIPGGSLASGDWVDPAGPDWSFAKDVGEIELQLESQSTSRTTWILVRDGQAWIPCSLGYPPGKTWYQHVASDGRAVLRIDGKRYAVTLSQDADPSLADFARSEVTRKYGRTPPGDAGVIFFRVEPRARGSASVQTQRRTS